MAEKDWLDQFPDAAPAEATATPSSAGGAQAPIPTDWVRTLEEVSTATPQFLMSNLPTIGATAAQIGTRTLGAPGAAMVGLAAGGGEALNQLGSRFLNPGEGRTWMNPSNPNVPNDPGEAWRRINNAMMLNTILSAPGRGMAAGMPATAERMAEHAVHPSASLQRMYPDMGRTIVKERMKVGPGREGTEAAEGLIASAQGEVEKALTQLPKGTMFNRDAVLSKVYDFIEEQGKSVLSPKERKEMAQKFLQDLGYSWPGRPSSRIASATTFPSRRVARVPRFENKIAPREDLMSPEDVRELMKQADAEAQRIYQSWAKSPTAMPTDVQLGEGFSLALRRGAKEVLARESPQFGKALDRLSRLHGARAAISESEMGGIAGQVPGGSRVYFGNISAHGEMLSPRIRNRIALQMSQPWFQNLIATSPQLAYAVIQNLTRSMEAGQ